MATSFARGADGLPPSNHSPSDRDHEEYFPGKRLTTIAAENFFAEGDDWQTLPQRLKEICQILENWDMEIGSVGISRDPRECRRLAMTAAIMASAPPSFASSFRSFFLASLDSREIDDDSDSRMDTASSDQDSFECLRSLGWVGHEGILMQPLGEALHHFILSKVRDTIAGEFEEENLYPSLLTWKQTVLDTWLQDLFGTDRFHEEGWADDLQSCVAKFYCLVRMDEIFDMVADYPDSHIAVLELRDVLRQTQMHSELGDVLRSSLVRRLNHPGANTSQIIDCYINTIKVLREIDPSDQLLEVVTKPVRSYLRGRNDTVRCIITSLTDVELGGDLYAELRRQDARPLEHVADDSDDEEEPPDFDWQPPPSITNPKVTFLVGAKGGGSDILSTLVSIYGSKELFVNEYRLILAEKLLANLDFNTDKEVHTLELLKLRFGEMSMRNCEIMIKDMDDSKRIVSNIHSTIKSQDSNKRDSKEEQEPITDCVIISHIFWPSLQNRQLKHHPRIQAGLDQFGTEYGRLKNPRRLIWFDQLGSVQLELDVVADGPDGQPIVQTKEFTCEPLLATLISHFEDKDTWTGEDLSNETGIPEHIIQKKMEFWVSNRVVKATFSSGNGISYQVASIEHLSQGSQSIDTAVMDLDGGDGQTVSVLAQEEEEMEIYESFIVGMLTNLGQLPLNRIHNMLTMYVSGGSDVKYNKTPQQLGVFLKHLCKQEKLECGPDGMYKLVTK